MILLICHHYNVLIPKGSHKMSVDCKTSTVPGLLYWSKEWSL